MLIRLYQIRVGIMVPVTGLDGLGCASYGVAAGSGGKQMPTGHLLQIGSSRSRKQKAPAPTGGRVLFGNNVQL